MHSRRVRRGTGSLTTGEVKKGIRRYNRSIDRNLKISGSLWFIALGLATYYLIPAVCDNSTGPNFNTFFEQLEARKKVAYQKLARKSNGKELLEIPIGTANEPLSVFLQTETYDRLILARGIKIHGFDTAKKVPKIETGYKWEYFYKAWEQLAKEDAWLDRNNLSQKRDEACAQDDNLHLQKIGLIFLTALSGTGLGCSMLALHRRRLARDRETFKLSRSPIGSLTVIEAASVLGRASHARGLSQEELLRAAQGSVETPPGQLLRAVQDRAGNFEGRVDMDKYTKSSAPAAPSVTVGGQSPAP